MRKNYLSITSVLGVLGLAITPAVMSGQSHTKELVIKALPPKAAVRLTVTSPAFKDGANIPYENTQYRGSLFPAFPGPGARPERARML